MQNAHALDACGRVCLSTGQEDAGLSTSDPPPPPKEALRAQGLDDGWVVALEVWLCYGPLRVKRSAALVYPRWEQPGEYMGLVGLWSTPLIRLQIVS